MKNPPFNPFEYLTFQPDVCFLTGRELGVGQKKFVPVFPEWLIKRYHLEEAQLTMLNWNKMKYGDMMLPASDEVVTAINRLDDATQKAFEQGYEAVKALPELTIFQWMARIMYGVLFQDLNYTIVQRELKGQSFKLSLVMQRKFKNLLFMLQSLIRPVVFDAFTPWSMKCCRVNISKDVLNYKDETHKLNFCLGMNGFGIVACLQDNGEIAEFHKDILRKIGDNILHPAQFEELYGRFMYANYTLRETPDYELSEGKENALVFRMSQETDKNVPKFAKWDDKIFAQVLTNMWDPWGIPIQKIYTFPNSPISYLIDEFTQELIPKEKVDLDY